MRTPKTPEEKRLEQEQIKELLSTIPGLEVVGFVEPTGIRRAFEEKETGMLSRRSNEPTEDQVLGWILGILKQENIQGRFLLSISLLARFALGISWPGLWVEIDLSYDYEWLEPLWKLHQDIYFKSLDLTKYLNIWADEWDYLAEAGIR